MKYQENLIQKL